MFQVEKLPGTYQTHSRRINAYSYEDVFWNITALTPYNYC